MTKLLTKNMPKVMKKKCNSCDSCTHLKFQAAIIIDDRIINLETIYNESYRDLSVFVEATEQLKLKYFDMYRSMLDYRKKYGLETMKVSVEFWTSHSTDNLPI